jgi:elongation factor P--beta-lysine ligase
MGVHVRRNTQHWELNDTDDEEELRRFEERLKKELTRSTTKPELLEHYLDVIRQLPECEKAGLVIPQYIDSKHLDSEIEEALRNISSDLSKSLRNKDPD